MPVVQGRMEMDMETVNYALDGTPIHTQLARNVLPGHEQDWARILISLTDISARKKAEEHLSYLGTHDLLTGLYNRGHFEERLVQIEKAARYPASIMMIDLNGLKQANDQGGHEAGDAMIRRAAEVVVKVAGEGDVAARLGGDEFAVIFPGLDEHAAGIKLAQIKSLVEVNNRFYGGLKLSLSVGVATGHGGQLEQVQKQADAHMYEDKRAHYLRLGREGDPGAADKVLSGHRPRRYLPAFIHGYNAGLPSPCRAWILSYVPCLVFRFRGMAAPPASGASSIAGAIGDTACFREIEQFVYAPSRHSFSNIPETPKSFPPSGSPLQNYPPPHTRRQEYLCS